MAAITWQQEKNAVQWDLFFNVYTNMCMRLKHIEGGNNWNSKVMNDDEEMREREKIKCIHTLIMLCGAFIHSRPISYHSSDDELFLLSLSLALSMPHKPSAEKII